MMGRLVLFFALVAHVFVLVICTDTSDTADSVASPEIVPRPPPKVVRCPRVKKCPRNEEYSYCPQAIQRPQYCSEKGQPFRNTKSDRTACKEGCVCKENYLRTDNGTCIPAAQCPITCGSNEVLDNCPTDCDSDYCPYDEDIEECIPPDTCPPPACKCAFNHRRAFNGSCIPTKECPPFDCSFRPNEEFDPCPPLCPTDDCTQASPTGECPPQFGRIGIVLPCNPKCRCVKGFWRLNGICVPYGQCPGVCPANERYSECVQGECRALDCSEKDKPIPCVRIDPQFCIKHCVCVEGFLRAPNGTCVPEDECGSGVCPANERYSECVQGECRALDCSEKDKPVRCVRIDPQFCIKDCVCVEGFLRAPNGNCVPEDECRPQSCPVNEELVPCIQGVCRALNCSQKGQDVPCPDIPTEECDSGCICKEHYLRSDDGCCIPEDKCKPNLCPPNEEWSTCAQATCRPQDCEDLGKPIACPLIAEGYCEKACVCQSGFVRDHTGACIPEDQCPPKVCPLNEEWSTCAQATCRPQDCEDLGKPIACPLIAEGYCEKACVCQSGFVRDHTGACIPEDQCPPKICPSNEEWSTCAQATCRHQRCEDVGKPIACPFIADGYCEKACVCQTGFVRDASGACIPEDQCPLICGENEVLDNCSSTCTSDKCPKSENETQVCVKSDPCQPACKCAFNHRRSDDNICIPTEDCPPFECNRINEQYDACPPLCPTDDCTLPRVKGQCPFRIGIRLECNPKCQCKVGYGRVNGTCIPYDECPDLCPLHEEYSSCTQRVCRPQSCADKDLNMETCPSCDDSECENGCVCQEGFYRNDAGTCVAYEDCAAPLCPYPHEVYTKTKTDCPPNTCQALVIRKICDKNQVEYPGCVCEGGYLRLNGTCVPICDCPEMNNSPDCPRKE